MPPYEPPACVGVRIRQSFIVDMAAARRSSVRRLSSMGLMSAKSSSQVAPDKRRGGLARSTLVSKMSTNSTSSTISSVEEPDDTPPLVDGTQLGSLESS